MEELKTIQVIERQVGQQNKFLQSRAYDFKLNNGIIILQECINVKTKRMKII